MNNLAYLPRFCPRCGTRYNGRAHHWCIIDRSQQLRLRMARRREILATVLLALICGGIAFGVGLELWG